jgi:hypothetical protein
MAVSDIGLVGLAVMGQNLSLNVAEKGFPISVYNRSYDKTEAAVERAKKEGAWPRGGGPGAGGAGRRRRRRQPRLPAARCCRAARRRAAPETAPAPGGGRGALQPRRRGRRRRGAIAGRGGAAAGAAPPPENGRCVSATPCARAPAPLPLTPRPPRPLPGLGDKLRGYESVKDFVASLKKPRCGGRGRAGGRRPRAARNKREARQPRRPRPAQPAPPLPAGASSSWSRRAPPSTRRSRCGSARGKGAP